jgi:DNA-binding CsgD family transcriptional regulator
MEINDILCTTSAGDRLMRSGQLGPAKHLLETALHRCWAAGTPMCVPVLASVLIKVELRIGDLFAAAKLLPAMGGGSTWAPRTDLCALMVMAEEQGSRAALAWLSQRRPAFVDQPELFAEEPAAGPWLVRLIRPAGDRRLIDRILLAADNALGTDHARALADGDFAALERVAHQYADPWCAARAWEDLSDLARQTGRPDDAAAYADDALAQFDEIGAVRDASRVRQQLRVMGRRPARPAIETPIDPSAHGWAALTVTERTIAHLVGNALTNRQVATRVFLSPHTVNYHLRTIFHKLGIASRIQLAQITRAQTDLRGADAWSA